MRHLPDWGRRLLTVALIAAAAVFITRTVLVNSRELAEFEWRVRPMILLASVVAHIAVLAWGVFVWGKVLPFVGVRKTPFGALLRIWAFSNAARYIPGGVWQFLAAARLATSSGLPRVVIVSSILVHVILSLISAAVVSVATLPLIRLGLAPALAMALRVAIPAVALICVHPRLINLGLRLVTRLLRREVLKWEGRWIEGLGLLALCTVSWVLYGVAYFLFLHALTNVPSSALVASTGVNALSFFAGYLAVPVPSGAGVRELAMTILLEPILPAGVAAIAAVGARLWSIVAELGLVGLALVAQRNSALPDPPE